MAGCRSLRAGKCFPASGLSTSQWRNQMIVDIDAGNSRIKWRAAIPGREPVRGVADSTEELLTSVSGLPGSKEGGGYEPVRVRVASVRSEAWLSDLGERVRAIWPVDIEVARSAAHAAGVTSAYRDPGTLGVDRWLAMLAARARCPGLCVVIDCGTALTMDIIEADGRHRGGYIVPGLVLQWKALEATARVRLAGQDVDASGVGPAPGRTTEEAVRNGSIAMVSGWLVNDGAVQRAGSSQGLFVAGGDADLLIPGLLDAGLEVRREPDLVLDGLALALP